MITVPHMASVLRKVFDQDARALAREMGVIKRERKLNGATLLLLFVLGWLHHPKAGSSALARFAGTLGVTISKQGIEEHWTFLTAQWLYEVLVRAVQCLVMAQAVAIPLLHRFVGVYIEDGSSINLPDSLERYWRGCRGGNASSSGTKAAVKLTIRVDLLQGGLQGPVLQDGRSHESQSLLQQIPLRKGALWIADMGYFALVRLAQLSKAGVYFLMPGIGWSGQLGAGQASRSAQRAASPRAGSGPGICDPVGSGQTDHVSALRTACDGSASEAPSCQAR